MAFNRFDVSAKELVWDDPEAWVRAFGIGPMGPVEVIDKEAELPEVVSRMAERLNALPRPRAAKLWTATYLLLGLRFTEEQADSLLEGIETMRESTTYQKILSEGRKAGRQEGMKAGRQEGRKEGRKKGRDEGRLVEARNLLLRLGRRRFGEPGPEVVAAIDTERDVERLEGLSERILEPEVHDWEALLAVPDNPGSSSTP